jgi:mono/diheme cytochrome c family protein
MGCGGCHRLAAGGGSGDVGPALDTRLAGYGAATLRARIVDPYPVGEPTCFAAMPQDFGTRMSGTELDALVAFLFAAMRR